MLQTPNFFIAGKTDVDTEPGTLHWFSFQIDTKVDEPARFSIFDTFANEADCDDHTLTYVLARSMLCLTPPDVKIDPHEDRGYMTPMVMINGHFRLPKCIQT